MSVNLLSASEYDRNIICSHKSCSSELAEEAYGAVTGAVAVANKITYKKTKFQHTS
jgi:hypothetical protein